MRQLLALFIASFIGVAFAACEQSPVGMDRDSSALTPSGKPAHAHGPVVVDENPEHGWIFNRDFTNFTPAAFSFDEASLGSGSLHAEPITSPPAAKLILEYYPNPAIPVSNFGDFSIDFLIDGSEGATDNDAQHFYINVYTLFNPDLGGWSDCRFDYVAGEGSTGDWTTLAIDGGTTPAAVAGASCPGLLEDMPPGSGVAHISVNIGQSNASDENVGGYLDNAVLTVSGSTTTFDFEPNCKDGGWESLTRPDGSSFKNQGQCMKYQKTGK